MPDNTVVSVFFFKIQMPDNTDNAQNVYVYVAQISYPVSPSPSSLYSS